MRIILVLVGCFFSLVVNAAEVGNREQKARFLTLDDAAAEMARGWQAGRKAKPIMSDDGKVVFPFGQSMPKLTCSPTRACDVEMQAEEKVFDVVLGDKINWSWAPSRSIEKGKMVQHLIFQPKDNTVETNAIITTDRRTYHIKLYAPKEEGIYLNRVGFYYPDELVTSWRARDSYAQAARTEVKARDNALRVSEEPFTPEAMDFDYKIEGEGDFKPLRVFNNGKKVYLEMPKAVLATGEAPVLLLIDEEGKANVVNYRVRGNHYVVDKLFTTAQLVLANQKVTIQWSKKAGWTWTLFGEG